MRSANGIIPQQEITYFHQTELFRSSYSLFFNRKYLLQSFRMIPRETINKAIDYILLHLTAQISVDDVADFCGWSKFYFCREFKRHTGQSVHSFIKRMRLEQITMKLKTGDRTISDICLDYGISPSNFVPAFKKQQNISPFYFRKESVRRSVEHDFFHSAADGKARLASFEEVSAKVTIENLPDYFVIYERKIGSYHDMKNDWCVFMEKYQPVAKKGALCFERTFDDPSCSDENRCLYDLCIEAEKDCPLENTCVIPGGKFAVYHFKGSHKEIYAAYQNMYNVWFPKSGARFADRMGFDRYVYVNDDATYMEIDLCFPVE